jgi:uncharacterized lipoprotein NlpE involved in copper resistance|tara:strand:+ start:3599 stop:3919 length:321 start_codon:yes stop_codon:yes gene_type:complete
MSAAALRVDELKQFVADKKGIPTEEQLNKALREETLVVTFNKLDGAERVMTCTKSFDVIPEANQPKSDKPGKEGNVTVWDVNANGWRSFKYERVTKVEKVVDTKQD